MPGKTHPAGHPAIRSVSFRAVSASASLFGTTGVEREIALAPLTLVRYDAPLRPGSSTSLRVGRSAGSADTTEFFDQMARKTVIKRGANYLNLRPDIRERRDPRCWDVDRMHLSTRGHTRMAEAVLATLDGRPLPTADFAHTPHPRTAARRAEDWQWAREHLGPWVRRRVQGTSSGDGISPKHAALVRLGSPADPAAHR